MFGFIVGKMDKYLTYWLKYNHSLFNYFHNIIIELNIIILNNLQRIR
jgi:hypothetical protein